MRSSNPDRRISSCRHWRRRGRGWVGEREGETREEKEKREGEEDGGREGEGEGKSEREEREGGEKKEGWSIGQERRGREGE